MALGRHSHHNSFGGHVKQKETDGFATRYNSNVSHFLHLRPGSYFQDSEAYQNLTPSQKKFANQFFSGSNSFLTGPAGTGKTFLMRAIFDFCTRHNIAVAKTASTGIAAFNLGGQTIHSWAGLGLGDEPAQNIIAKVKKNRKVTDRIQKTKILVIDEISMIKAELLDKLDIVLKYVRSSSLPFGGLQIVFVGDGLQLPPVWKKDEVKDFFFNSRSWREAGVKTVLLKEIIRQDAHGDFAKVLNQIRVGDVSGLKLLSSRINAEFPKDEIEPVRIFCKNVDVDLFNAQRLAELPGVAKRFKSMDCGQEHHISAFNKNCPAPENLELKIGAQVMLLSNIDVKKGFVNGSVGVVKGFTSEGISVKFQNGTILVDENTWEIKEQEAMMGGGIRYKVVATRVQYPLRLAWGVTAHKSQGSTLDRAIIDMKEAFAEGIIYVSLSRVRNLESLSIVDEIPIDKIKVNQECLDFYSALESESS